MKSLIVFFLLKSMFFLFLGVEFERPNWYTGLPNYLNTFLHAHPKYFRIINKKKQAIYSGDIVDLKILQSDWLGTF